MRALPIMIMASYALASCMAPAQSQTGPDARMPSANAVDSLESVTIRGCCSFSVPTNSVRGAVAQVTDGFAAVPVSYGDETVVVTPYLGFYEWLDAGDGRADRVGGMPARSVEQPSGGQKTVIALERETPAQATPLTVTIETSCSSESSCPLYDHVKESFFVESRWQAYDPQ